MNSKIKKTSSRLSGFVNSYKASNIANIESSIRFHMDEIKNKLSELLAMEIDNRDLFVLLQKSYYILNESTLDYFDILIQFGESFKTSIIISKTENIPGILTDSRMKMIVYHYLELAEKLEDRRVNSLAIEIGELLD